MIRQFLLHQLLVRMIIAPSEQHLKRCLHPASAHPVRGAAMDVTRSKSELIAENAFLRQQRVVLRRQTKRPAFTPLDRGLLVLLASRLQTWKDVLLIVKPDTLLRWHRQGLRWFWRQKSKAKTRQPRVPQEVIALIHAMALDHRLWGAKRIRDELRKLGYPLAKRTVAKSIPLHRLGKVGKPGKGS
jgi:hypothetical protein